MNERNLKAFVATFYIKDKDEPQSVAVVALNEKEAHTTFTKWAKGRQLYDRLESIVIQRIRKSERNKHMFTLDFYNRQNAFVDKIYNKGK